MHDGCAAVGLWSQALLWGHRSHCSRNTCKGGEAVQGCKVLTCSVAVVRKPVGCGVFNSFGSKYLLDSLYMASLEVITA